MAISTIKSEDGSALTIKIQGRFDFGEHQAFCDAYERITGRLAEYVIDLNETTYLDSSALGMLLLLRDHAGGDEADIKIVNCKPDVKKILLISNFEQLFAIQ